MYQKMARSLTHDTLSVHISNMFEDTISPRTSHYNEERIITYLKSKKMTEYGFLT